MAGYCWMSSVIWPPSLHTHTHTSLPTLSHALVWLDSVMINLCGKAALRVRKLIPLAPLPIDLKADPSLPVLSLLWQSCLPALLAFVYIQYIVHAWSLHNAVLKVKRRRDLDFSVSARVLPEPHRSLFPSLCNTATHEGVSALLSHLAVYTVVLNLVYNNTQGLRLVSVWVCMSVYSFFVYACACESVCVYVRL